MIALRRFRRTRSGLGMPLAIGLLAMLAVRPAWSDSADVTVVLDRAKLVKLPDRVTTLVIGNPLIVDAALQTGGAMVLTGKGYGSTNVMALDHAGNVLMNKIVQVESPEDTVVVYRGTTRQTYSCTSNCEPQITLGDDDATFKATLGQTVERNAQAQASAH